MTLLDPINVLPSTLPQASLSALTETWAIDNTLRYYLGNYALTLGIRYIPKTNVSAPLPASVLSGVAAASGTDTYLATGSTYGYAVVYRTKWGETLPGSRVNLTGSTGYDLTITGAPVSTQNPVIERRLYRTSGYTGSAATDFRLIAVLDAPGGDVTATVTYTDGIPDDMRGPAAQIADRSAGPTGQVVITDAHYGTWTEVPYGSTPGVGQYAVDYNPASSTAGSVLFNTADSSLGTQRTVTIVYHASALVNSGLMNSILAGLKSVYSAWGQPSGIPKLDVNGFLINQLVRGVMSSQAETATTWGPYSDASHGIYSNAGSQLFHTIDTVSNLDTVVTEIVGQLTATNPTITGLLTAWSTYNGTDNPKQTFYTDTDGRVRFSYKFSQHIGVTSHVTTNYNIGAPSGSWGFGTATDFITMQTTVIRG